MFFKTRTAPKKRRDIKFAPDSLGERRPNFVLEPRFLAKPAFYMVTGSGILDQVQTSITGGSTNTALSSASSSGTVTDTIQGVWGQPNVTYQQVGMVTSQVVDTATAGSPNYVLSMNVTQDHKQSVSNNPIGFGPTNGFLTMTSNANGQRTYRLADDGTAPVGGPVTLTEKLSFTLLGPAHSNTTVTGGMSFTGFNFSVTATYPAPPQVMSKGPQTTVVTSTSGGVFNLTATTPYPSGLPANPGGTPVNLSYGSTLTTQLHVASNYTDDVNISMNYGAHF